MIKYINSSVEYVDHMGSDLSVVNAARVSFDKISEYNENGNLSPRDEKLIHYLAVHNHWTTFAHCSVSFRIKAPIIVARQLVKHQVGLVWNEVSRRYVDSPPEFFTVDAWRKRAENVKQGSSEDTIVWLDRLTKVDSVYNDVVTHCSKAYDTLIAGGVCPEQARLVLPVASMTEWIWTGSLYAFARVCNLRVDSHTQKETTQVAEQISDICSGLFPVSWKNLVNYSVVDNKAS